MNGEGEIRRMDKVIAEWTKPYAIGRAKGLAANYLREVAEGLAIQEGALTAGYPLEDLERWEQEYFLRAARRFRLGDEGGAE